MAISLHVFSRVLCARELWSARSVVLAVCLPSSVIFWNRIFGGALLLILIGFSFSLLSYRGRQRLLFLGIVCTRGLWSLLLSESVIFSVASFTGDGGGRARVLLLFNRK